MSDQCLYLAAHAVIADESGRLLLAKRDDARTWGLPGGTLDPGELPMEAVVREVAEETGLEVVPARLVAVYHLSFARVEYLSFGFRCLQAGGELRPSRESPQLGYFPLLNPPGRMMEHSREQAEVGARHVAAAPILRTQRPSARLRLAQRFVAPLVYQWFDWRRRLKQEPRYTPPPRWQVSVEAAISDGAERYLWWRGEQEGSWHLPGGRREPWEAPWDALAKGVAARSGLRLKEITLREVLIREGNLATLRFAACIDGQPGPQARFFAVGEEPAGADTAQRNWIGDLEPDHTGVRFERA